MGAALFAVFGAGAVGLPDGHGDERCSGVGGREARAQCVEEDTGDVLHRGVYAGGGGELGRIEVEVGVVEAREDGGVGGEFQVVEREAAGARRARPVQRNAHGGLELVVVPMPVEIVALAERGPVGLIRHRRHMQAVRGGEIKPLAQEGGGGGGGGGRVRVGHGALHFDAVPRREPPADAGQACRRGCVRAVCDVLGEGGEGVGEQLGGIGGGVIGGDARRSDARDEDLANGAVAVLDVDEVAGGGVGCALAGEFEFVVATQAAHGGRAGETVHAAGLERGGRGGGGVDDAPDCATKGEHECRLGCAGRGGAGWGAGEASEVSRECWWRWVATCAGVPRGEPEGVCSVDWR